MTDVKIVVGANFGDEGKGLMADYFCHQAVSQGKKCLNVLTNGGAQRGHTVVYTDRKRHVFKHFSSGICQRGYVTEVVHSQPNGVHP
nr:adenylosuccinate synthetase [Bifidobacterium catenulatum]